MRRTVACTLALLLTIAATRSLSAQGSNAGDGWRIGLSFGGISTLGVTFEIYRDSRSLDLTLGSWTFRDVSLSAVVRQYVGGSRVRPFVGAGLWTAIALAGGPPDERTGLGLVARVPVGLDWNLTGGHNLGAALNLSRALAVRRPDPQDDKPLVHRIVPLPSLEYRWRR